MTDTVLAMTSDGRSAAIAVDGGLVAAVHNWRAPRASSDAATGGVDDGAVEECLSQAGMRRDDISVRCRLGDGEGATVVAGTPEDSLAQSFVVTAGAAHLAQTAAVLDGPGLLMVVDGGAAPLLGIRREFGPAAIGTDARLARALDVARRTASALGIDGVDSIARMERLAGDVTPDYLPGLREILAEVGGGAASSRCLEAIVEAAQNRCLGRLRETGGVHRGVHEGRAALAASAIGLICEVFAASADAARDAAGVERTAMGGSLFSAPGLNGRIARSIGGVVAIAPVPEPAGLTLGAALAVAAPPAAPIRHVALGRPGDEYEIKQVLENCRLEYLYEPEWERLAARVSTLLGAGKLVGWYQTPMDFGPRSLGSRSILCDPSSRYARENVNVFLRRTGASAVLGVSLTREGAAETLVDVPDSPFMLLDGTANAAGQNKLKAALDGSGRCPVHISDGAAHPELEDLLRVHHSATGVPGLINVGLEDEDGRLVTDPRAAIRAAFSSAVDVLVLGRFIVSKDYWLLRGSARAAS